MQIYNSYGKKKELFKARSPKRVKLFSCGPSVYRKPHIGNYRTFAYEDMVVRYLEYLGYETERTTNFTDIEDKAVNEAVAEGRDVYEQTAPAKAQYTADLDLLKIKKPDHLPMASTSVKEAIEIIKILLDKGFAYDYKGSVFFDPLKAKDFGKLYGLDMSKWPKKRIRYKLDTYPGENWNMGDFILWHKADQSSSRANAVWDSPFGKGRPSWNIQDPAMVLQTLGWQIDINMGGIDNIVRHHDYNIAVIESASGLPYANYYMHGAHLNVHGKKMSKSLGNIIYPQDLIKEGFSGQEIRYFLLAVKHYRTRLNFTPEKFKKAVALRAELELSAQRALSSVHAAKPVQMAAKIKVAFEEPMNDDLNVPEACDRLLRLFKTTRSLHASEKNAAQTAWQAVCKMLQFF